MGMTTTSVPGAMGVGAVVRALRLKRGLSQGALATTVGVQRTYLCALEADRDGYNMSLNLLRQLAVALDVPPAILLAGEGSESDEVTLAFRRILATTIAP